MSRDKFDVVVKGIITLGGSILIGQKEDGDRPHSGEWHFLGGHVEKGEDLKEAMEREAKEETSLDVDVLQIVDAMAFSKDMEGPSDALMVFYHCEASSRDASPEDDLKDVKWVEPGDLAEELWDEEASRIKSRKNLANFVEKLKKMPSRGSL